MKNRVAIYSQLFEDGVCVVKKDPMQKQHPEIEVPNLHVMQTMKSLESRNYIRDTFSWQYYYYYLTDFGIEYLRSCFNLPSNIKPATLTPPPRQSTRPSFGGRGGDRPPRRYGDSDKRMGPGGDFRPSYRDSGGFGRGAMPPRSD